MAEEEQGKLSSQEREEKPEEQGQEHPSTGASSDQPPLEALEALAVLQVELSSANETDPKAYLWLQRKDHQRRKRPSSHRSAIIQGNPGLWANAVSLVLLLRGQMLRRTIRNRSRRRGGGEGTRQLRGGHETGRQWNGSSGVLSSPQAQCQQRLQPLYLYVSEPMTMGG